MAAFARDNKAISVDNVLEHLQEAKGLENTPEACRRQRTLVFAILGWQSMLYRAAFKVCSFDELAIAQDDDQTDSGSAFDTAKVSSELADRPLFVLLKGFGHLLPARTSNAAQLANESSKTASTWLPLDPAKINAHLLTTLLRVQICWVDCLALHLDYNKSTRTQLPFFLCSRAGIKK